MTKLESIDQIRELIAAVRAKRLGLITDFFLDEEKHQLWIDKCVLFYVQVNDSLFFIKKNISFCNGFYTSISATQLSYDLKQLYDYYPEEKFVFDIIGKDIQCQSIVEKFKEAGYVEICSLIRMSRITPEDAYCFDEAISYATEDDIFQISSLLHSNFNEKAEQIPYDEELRKLILKNQILVCKIDNSMLGFLIFEINASILYLRYWFTNPDFRDKKVGSKLLRAFFKIGEVAKRQQLWVVQSNRNAIARYEHYGFMTENMFDYIMVNNNKK